MTDSNTTNSQTNAENNDSQTENSRQEKSETARMLENGVKLIGERIVPGASLLMDGQIVEGAAHAAVGFGARMVFGVPGAVALMANSYTKSVTGKGILTHITEFIEKIEPARSSEKSDETTQATNSNSSGSSTGTPPIN